MEKKSPLKSKTIWFGAAVTALALFEQASGFVTEFLSPQYAPMVVAVIGAVVIVLRFLTGSPVVVKSKGGEK
tara:strand:+ start:91 stop:306 length:216 start_codon:yes stop_codon:yes gene_type:complete